MRLTFDVAVGLASSSGIWFGLRVKGETKKLVADRNIEMVLEGPASTGELPAREGGLSDFIGLNKTIDR